MKRSIFLGKYRVYYNILIIIRCLFFRHRKPAFADQLFSLISNNPWYFLGNLLIAQEFLGIFLLYKIKETFDNYLLWNGLAFSNIRHTKFHLPWELAWRCPMASRVTTQRRKRWRRCSFVFRFRLWRHRMWRHQFECRPRELDFPSNRSLEDHFCWTVMAAD